MEEKIKRLKLWREGKKQNPLAIELSPTNRCNSNCLTCWRRGVSNIDYTEMDDDRLLALIDEANDLNVREIAFVGGGEPLMRTISLELMEKIKGYGMWGDVVTNGTLFKRKDVERLVEAGWDNIKFSVDGPDAPTHDYIRGLKNNFRTTLRNIVLINHLKKKKGLEKPRITFNTVISALNYRKFPEMIELAHKVGCEEVCVLPMTVFSESMRKFKLSDSQVKEFSHIIDKAHKIATQHGIESNMMEFKESKYLQKTEEMNEIMEENLKRDSSFENAPCFMPWYHITITSDGNTGPCFSPLALESPLNLQEKSLKEVWFSSYFDKIRKHILKKSLPEACSTCCVWRVFENREIRNALLRKE